MLKRALFRVLAGVYLGYRGLIGPEDLKRQTVEALQRYLDLVEKPSEEQLQAHPFAGKWSGQEITFHAVNSAKRTFRICEGLHNEQDVPDMDRSAVGRTKSVSQEDLMHLCQRVHKMAEEFNYKSHTSKTCAHALFGQRTFHQWLVINLLHLQRHYQQLVRVTQFVSS